MARPSITDVPAITWDQEELPQGPSSFYPSDSGYEPAFSKHNPTPGTGRTGFIPVPPNNYPFYGREEVYTPVMQADGGQLSEWKPMYAPSKEQAELDRAAAYEAGVPHGYVAPGDKFRDLPTIKLLVVSDLHDASEYGSKVDANGRHSGGPFTIKVSPAMRVEEVRRIIRDVGGIMPALQKLSFAGKHLNDSQRTLQQYGIAYWHSKFPHWPIKIRRH